MPTTPKDASDEADDVVEFIDDEIGSIEDFVQTKPITALLIAAAIGLVIGRFVI
jgi:ElaB/YqjD/DUF883 family membrane-anchored ribosome-binding protein